MASISAVISQYKKEVIKKDVNAELEVRFKGISYNVFKHIYTKLSANITPTLTQRISVIKAGPKSMSNKLNLSLIREIDFNMGSKSEKFLSKNPLISFKGTNYQINLSLEKPEKKFNQDNDVLIRIKIRMTFVKVPWRIDMTMVISLSGNQIEQLPKYVDKYCKKSITKDDFISLRDGFSYEIEAEFDNSVELTETEINNIITYINEFMPAEDVKNTEFHNIIRFVAKILIPIPGKLAGIRNLGLKTLLPQVIALNKSEYRAIYPPKDMFITLKADGIRCLALIKDGKGYLITNDLKEISTSQSKELYTSQSKELTILDGELLQDGTFIIFDVIIINDKHVYNQDFRSRFTYLDEANKTLAENGFSIYVKPYIYLQDDSPKYIKEQIENLISTKLHNDGIIIVDPDNDYINTKTYKWKDAANNTIDFLIKYVKSEHESLDSKHGKFLHYLFVGITQHLFQKMGLLYPEEYNELFPGKTEEVFFPTVFSPSDNPNIYKFISNEILDNKIVEMRYANDKWELVKIRHDRDTELNSGTYYGNMFDTAEMIWSNYIDEFPIEQLWDGPISEYFTTVKKTIYNEQIYMVTKMKEELITSLKGVNTVVDIGIGKGQDLGRYLKLGIKQLIGIDKDRSALTELVRRKYNFAKSKSDIYSTTINILAADINEGYENVLQSIEKFAVKTVDAIVCNLAVHYFMSTTETMENFCELVNSLSHQGTKVILTMFSGEKINKLLIENNIKINESWIVHQDLVKKYQIKRLYTSDELEPSGQKIGVLLPFSEGELYEEYLVNIAELTKILLSKGFELTSSVQPSCDSKDLTEDDCTYLQLFEGVTYTKIS